MATTNLRDLRDRLSRQLQLVPGVGAVGVSWTPGGSRCLRVSVAPGFAHRESIPATFEGLPVVVQTAEKGQLSSGPS